MSIFYFRIQEKYNVTNLVKVEYYLPKETHPNEDVIIETFRKLKLENSELKQKDKKPVLLKETVSLFNIKSILRK